MCASRLEFPLSNVATLARTCTFAVPFSCTRARPSTCLVMPCTSSSLCTTVYERVPSRTSSICAATSSARAKSCMALLLRVRGEAYRSFDILACVGLHLVVHIIMELQLHVVGPGLVA